MRYPLLRTVFIPVFTWVFIWALLAPGATTAVAAPQDDPDAPPAEADPAMDEAPAMDDAGDDFGADEVIEEMEERITYLEEAMDEVEKRSVLDRLYVGADYRLVFNAFRYKGPSPDPYDRDPANPALPRTVTKSSPEIWSHRLRIPMRGDITKNIRITARLLLFKHFGDNDEPPFLQDFQATRFPRDSAVHLEQAWIDWFLTDWFAISAGRFAYTGINPPGELRENANVRSPTWGLQIIDGEYEAINFTFNLSRKVGTDLYLRTFYASWFPDLDTPTGDFLFLGAPSQRILGVSADMLLPKLGTTYLQLGYLVLPKFPGLPTPIPDPGFDPANNYTNAPPPYDGSLLFPSVLPDDLGSYQNFNMLIEGINIAEIGLDAFIGGSIGILSSNDTGVEYELPNPANPAERVSTPYLFLHGAGDSGIAYSFMAGARYTLPEMMERKPKLGLEYNYGSKYYMSFAIPHDQLVSKWATRGHAVEGYLIMPIYGDQVFMRVGLLVIDNNYLGGLLGINPALSPDGTTAPPVAQDILNFNAMLQATL